MPRFAYLIGIIAAVAIFTTIAYTYSIGMEMGVQNAPLLEAAEEIDIQLTTAHLWFEELIGGDRECSIEEVIEYIDRADRHAAALLEGGVSAQGRFHPVMNEAFRADVRRVRKGIARLRQETLARWQEYEAAGIGSETEQQYDKLFKAVLAVSGGVKGHLKELIRRRISRFQGMVFVLLGISALVSCYGLYYIRKRVIEAGIARQKVLDSHEELKVIIDELKRSESQITAIVEAVGDAIITIDTNGSIETFNSAASRIFGYTPHEIIGQNVSMLMPEPYRSGHDNFIKRYLDTGEKKIIGRGREAEGLRKDGSVFPIYLNVTEAYSINKRIFVGIVQDITGRKETQHQLEALASFPELNPSPIVELDAEYNATYENPASQQMFPRLRELGSSHTLLADIKEELAAVLKDAKPLAIHTVPVGEKVYEIHISNVAGEDKVRLYITDVTERKHAEERLRLSAKFFEETTEALVVTDLDANILDANAAFEAMSGYKKEEILGKNPRILKSGRHDSEFYKEMWRSILETGSWQGEIWDRRKNGEIYPKWMSISTVRDDLGNPTHYVGISADISKLKQTEEQLEYLAHYDQLTGLPNRLLAHERLEQGITLSKRHGHTLALLLLDLDEFKRINDSLGHLAGDQLLNEVGRRIKNNIRESDSVARIGGDEFTVLLRNIHDPANAAHLAQKLIDSLSEPYYLNEHEVFVSVSIGITLCPDDGEDMFALMKNADAAMYHAKRTGKNRYQFFTEELNARIMERLVLEMRLRRAVENKDMSLHYQPRVDLASGEVVGMEALLRWEHPEYGSVPPASFVPIAEDTGLIIPLGQWVLREACEQTVKWNEELGRKLCVSVNLSARQFRGKGLIDDVRSTLRETGLAPELLDLEITESVVMDDVEQSIAVMKKLRDMGVSLSVDDFGTGYSSLSYLKRFPMNSLKVDRSFVMDITHDPEDKAVVKAIIVLAKSLGIRVIAEGVETREQLDFLHQEGCDEIQGYYYSRPLPSDVFSILVQENLKL